MTAILQGRKLDFIEAMKLEIERLRLNLSAAERDRALLSVGTDPATINPNLLLDELYIGRLCGVANNLALLGQASLEDKITAVIGLDPTDDNVIDFWNIAGIGETCSGGMCEVCAETKTGICTTAMGSSAGGSQSFFLCSQCGRKICKVCCAGRGALLLQGHNSKEISNYNGISSQSGLSRSCQVDVSANRSEALDDVICKRCCQDIVLDALFVDYVRVLVSLRKSARADSAAHKALNQVVGSSLRDCLSEGNQPSDYQQAVKILKNLLNGEQSLAEFPFASFLHSVLSHFHTTLLF